jgi:hypothetical protein
MGILTLALLRSCSAASFWEFSAAAAAAGALLNVHKTPQSSREGGAAIFKLEVLVNGRWDIVPVEYENIFYQIFFGIFACGKS